MVFGSVYFYSIELEFLYHGSKIVRHSIVVTYQRIKLQLWEKSFKHNLVQVPFAQRYAKELRKDKFSADLLSYKIRNFIVAIC